MPKRVVDGEAIATSFKIRRIQEEWRIHYPYLLTLALANGTFECDPEVIWAKRYAIFMPSMTKEHVAEMIRAFEGADLLRTWRDKEGRLCGWWVGINKPGRLPPKSRLKRHEEALGPELPRAVLSQPTCNLTAGHQVESVGAVQDGAQETPTEHVRNTSCGLGLGLGLGEENGAPLVGQNAEAKTGTVEAPVFEGARLRISNSDHERLQSEFGWFDLMAIYRDIDVWMVEKNVNGTGYYLRARNWLKKEAKKYPKPRPTETPAVGRSRPTPEGEAILEKYGVH